MAYRAVIFDVDGTLVDSNDAHAQAWVDVLAERGRRVSFERVRPLIGMGGDKILPLLAGVEAESPEGEQLSLRRRELFERDQLPDLEPTPGAPALVSRLRDHGLTLVIASSAGKEELEGLLRAAGAEFLIQSAASSDDAERSKPDPDIVQAALAKTGCASGDAVMIGDTPYDVEAAHRAGIGIICFRCGGWGDDALKGALAIYDNPQDLLNRLDDSAFFKSAGR
jgi:HAD superfamily hydrolase (TIGR01509 family)